MEEITVKTSMRWILIGLALVILSSCGYNMLQKSEEAVFKAWGDVDSQLQRRSDLIPNLVATVKGYAAHEKETLEAVVEARAKATQVTIKVEDLGDEAAMAKLQAAQGELSSALGRLLAVAEAYPDLKASQNYLQLQTELVNTEDRIQAARRFYNGNVRENNNLVEMFPTNIIAGMFHFARREFFEIADVRERSVPDASL